MTDVLFLASGTYPYYQGGVSTWANSLLSTLSEYDFDVISVVSNPHVECRYSIPSNVKNLQMLPIWGVVRPEEFSRTPARKLLRRIYLTRSRGIEEFLLSFEKFLMAISSGGEKSSLLGEAVMEMHSFLRNHDYRTVVRDRKLWDLFNSFMESRKEFSGVSVYETIETCRTLVRHLEILTVDVPKSRLVHSSIASAVGFLAVVAKLRDQTPFILTEHGVYYRERLLDITGRYKDGQKRFWILFERAVSKLSYDYADRIAPVSKFNAQWEVELGANEKRIEVIYNGVDTEIFKPMPSNRYSTSSTVTAVTRIDRLKGILDLVYAMTTVRKKVPNAKCLIFGAGLDQEYARLCLNNRDNLGLSDAVVFMGFTKETPKAFNTGDVVALPSVSEGFPYSLIEGMACGKATVATDVGGVVEALGDSGIVVPPRDPTSLGEALALLLKDSLHAKKLGVAARDRILNEYTVSKFGDEYRRVYRQMVGTQ
jgi:glycosyltransferase involved in cell wall biosynthesis